MNAKQTLPILTTLGPAIAAAAPPLLLIGGVALLACLILTGGKKPETEPAAETPKDVPVIPPTSIPAASKIFAPMPSPTVLMEESLPQYSLPQKRRIVSREDLARIFQNGARSLNRMDAVAELQKLGFGKTAAYKALSPIGKFASWLDIASDGIVSWKI
jgi:hypothetical protein